MRRKRVLMHAGHDSKEPFAFGWIAKLCACLCVQEVLKRRTAQEYAGLAMARSLRSPLRGESKAKLSLRGFAFASNSVSTFRADWFDSMRVLCIIGTGGSQH